MSLTVSIVVEVKSLDDTRLVQIMRSDTAVNEDPEDATQEVLTAAAMAERMFGEIIKDTGARFKEYLRIARKVG